MSGHPDPEHGTVEYLRVLTEPGALAAALNWYRALTLSDATRSLAAVTVPTLYVWGEDDMAFGRTAAEGTAAHVTGPYRFEPLAGVGHWVPDEAPLAIARLLLEHLAAHP